MTRDSRPQQLNAMEARGLAQRIAFGPLAFHAAVALRDMGVLEALLEAGDAGTSVAALAESLGISAYGVTVLLESGMGSGLVANEGDLFVATKAAWFVVHDEMSRVNFNFVRDVCYRGAEHLRAAIEQGRPAGLPELVDAPTVYEALGDLPEPARTSWFEFDHYYSAAAFPGVLGRVLQNRPRRLLDVGGNTGKWAVFAAKSSADLQVTILDHPNQLRLAAQRAQDQGVGHRVRGHAVDLLDHGQPFPGPMDVVWMSQLLSCFSERDCVGLMQRAAAALGPQGELLILENFWDRQRYSAASESLQHISLYFTAIANGTSRIYSARALARCLAEAGLQLVEEVDNIGAGHTFWRCRREA